MREVVLDTETTGLDPRNGHRLVEIACLELINHIPTGQKFHTYLNPERDIPPEAFKVHGLSADFLQSHPLFNEVCDQFLNFVNNTPLIIHNAEFDLKFLNFELTQLGRTPLSHAHVTDTLILARRKFPNSPNNLDALCKRLNVDNSGRTLHGALLDTELLAEVYLHLIGGRQITLGLGENSALKNSTQNLQTLSLVQTEVKTARPARPHYPTPEEKEAHKEFIASLKFPIWHSI